MEYCLSIKLLAHFVLSLAIEEESKKDSPLSPLHKKKKMNQDKELGKSSVQARTPGGSSVKLDNQGRTSQRDTNGKKERKRVALGVYGLGSRRLG